MWWCVILKKKSQNVTNISNYHLRNGYSNIYGKQFVNGWFHCLSHHLSFVSVLVLCNWKSKILLFMTSCAAKQMYWYGNWWFQLVVELLWVLSYWDVYMWGIWKELVRNAVYFYLSFNDLQIHFYLNIDAAFLTQNWELEKNILNANCIKVFPLLFLQKKILVHFQDLHRQVRNNK